MFSSTKRITRGHCVGCGIPKDDDVKLYVLDIKDTDMASRNWEPKLVESDADFAACLKCWQFVGLYISSHVRVQKYV